MTDAGEPGFRATLDALDAVVERSRARKDRSGFFAALYRGVTQEVADRAASGQFEHPERMQQFVCRFADRYLDAHRAWCSGRPTSESWAVAFASVARWRPVVLQHLLVGINAHINLDLGVTTVEIGEETGLALLAADFQTVNDVLASLVDRSQEAVSRVSPWFGLADRFGARGDEELVRFSLRRARDQAWQFAQRLAALPPSDRGDEIARVDRAVAGVARSVLHPGMRLSAPLLVVRLREPWRVAPVLDALTA
jgi:Family of unknown function (DUF5995)